MSYPKIIAHRGASWARPENTAAAFNLAMVEGADGLELDLQLTRDEQVVVFHDKTLSMLNMKHRSIAQYSRDELRALDVGAWFGPESVGERMLDLDEVLERYGHQIDLYLEIKPVAALKYPERALRLAHLVAERVAAHSHMHRLYVLSFSGEVLQQVARSRAELRCVRNLVHPADLQALPEERLQQLFGICVDIRHFSPEDVAPVHALGKNLYAYTVDAPKHLQNALNLNVHGVISNMPGQARRRLNQLTANPPGEETLTPS